MQTRVMRDCGISSANAERERKNARSRQDNCSINHPGNKTLVERRRAGNHFKVWQRALLPAPGGYQKNWAATPSARPQAEM